MNNTKTLEGTLASIDLWKKELKKYELSDLLKKPDAGSWSLGQVYNHLISASLNFHLKQIDTCLDSTENKNKSKSFKAFISYNILRKIPPVKIKVPASDAYTPKQPQSKDELFEGLDLVAEKMKNLHKLLQATPKQGKTPHPAFAYLNGDEWYKLVEMHLNHHFRQKEDLDAFLNG